MNVIFLSQLISVAVSLFIHHIHSENGKYLIIVGNLLYAVLWCFCWIKRKSDLSLLRQIKREKKIVCAAFCFYRKNVQTTNEIIAELNYCLDFTFGSYEIWFFFSKYHLNFIQRTANLMGNYSFICRFVLRITKYNQKQQQQQRPNVNEPEVLYLKIEENIHIAHMHEMSVPCFCICFKISNAKHKITSMIFDFTQYTH